MFEYIKGTLVHATPSLATLDIHGIGYRLAIPLRHFGKLPAYGSSVTFFVSTVIREDSHKLYGFFTQTERDLFEQLIGISGIGPKIALALLGHMELSELQTAISLGNSALICKIPGIGKKTAERLLVEMKDKIFIEHTPLSSSNNKTQRTISDALSALINLGYNASAAQKAIQTALQQTKEDPELAMLITAALRLIN
jgi:Holliday junction DNA helicase RuvA